MSGRTAKGLSIGLAVVSILTVAAWVASANWALLWQGSSFQTSVSGGTWTFAYWSSGYYGLEHEGLYFDGWGGGFDWWFKLKSPNRGPSAVVVPVWAFALLTGAWPAWFWLRCTRRRTGAECPKCGYSLTGLAKDAVCPECGHSRR